MSQRERVLFDPESIRIALQSDLPNGLRALADAIEAKDIDGSMVSVKSSGLFTNWRDDRAHVLVVIDVAAQIFKWRDGQMIPLPKPTIELPSVSAYELKGTKA